MIRYALRCADGHQFDGWFRSSDGFEAARDAGHITCAHCGSPRVDRALMAPSVSEASSEARPLTTPQNPAEAALDALRRKIEATSDDVGLRFAAEARAMHDGTTPARMIHGEARPEDARKLIEDGVPVAPLPFLPRRRVN